MKPIFLNLEDTAAAVALSTANVRKLMREEKFPKPRALSPRRIGWLVRELEEWSESREIADMLPPPSRSRDG
jgi:prophage regulatory protein